MKISLKVGKAKLVVEAVEKVGSKSGKKYIEVLQDGIKIGTLFQRVKGQAGWKKAAQEVSFQGDVYIQGGTTGLKAGDVQPETGCKIVEKQKADGTGVYLELEEAESQYVTRAFYKSETGTTTLSVIIK